MSPPKVQFGKRAVQQLSETVATVQKLLVNPTPAPRARWQKGGGFTMTWGSNVAGCLAGEAGTATLYDTPSTVGSDPPVAFVRYDADSGLTIPAGERILLGYILGEWVFLWADKLCPDPPV
jgi:hypothetical protein